MKQDFRNTKIRIKSEEHSKAFQKAIFEAGVGWFGSGKSYKQNLKFIYVNEGLLMTHAGCSTLFEEHTYKEIQFPLPIKGHVHADLMAQYAEDAKTTDKPWELWELQHANRTEWITMKETQQFHSFSTYRRKPKTHTVNGVEVPDLRFEPNEGEEYYMPNPVDTYLYLGTTCTAHEAHDHRKDNNLCYENTGAGKQAAIMHAKAWLGVA